VGHGFRLADGGRCCVRAKMDVLAITSELAGASLVQSAKPRGSDSNQATSRFTHGLIQGRGHSEVTKRVEFRFGVLPREHNGDRVVKSCRVHISMTSAARLRSRCTSPQAFNKLWVRMDLIAAISGIAAASLEEETQRKIFGIWRRIRCVAKKVGHSLSLGHERDWDFDLAGSVARVDDAERLGRAVKHCC